MRNQVRPIESIVTGIFVVIGLLSVAHADVTVNPKMVETRVENYVRESTPLKDPAAVLYVDVTEESTEPIVLKGDNLNISMEDTRMNPMESRGIVQVTLTTDQDVRHIGVPVRISVEKPVWIAKCLIRPKETISAQNAVLQRKRLSDDALYSLGSQENVQNYTARTTIEPGSLLDLRKLTMIPAVYNNEEVRLVMNMESGVVISVEGKALEDGTIGKRIRVSRKLGDNKIRYYTGEVIGRNLVQINI
jgi:flagella basal body P-ring formation protein FlgA